LGKTGIRGHCKNKLCYEVRPLPVPTLCVKNFSREFILQFNHWTARRVAALTAIVLMAFAPALQAEVQKGAMSTQKIAFGSGGGGPTGIEVVGDFHVIHIDGFQARRHQRLQRGFPQREVPERRDQAHK
jgi:hypothetical protein